MSEEVIREDLIGMAFVCLLSHKGEPELANKGHEVAFICEYL